MNRIDHDGRRGSCIADATIRLTMGKYRLADARGRFILRILAVALLLNLAVAGPGYAQMGVATGNGVATPAKPLPAGMKPPVVRYEDIAAQAGLTGVNVSGDSTKKQ